MRHRPALAGHAAFEVYSVLTRLPGAQRVEPAAAHELLVRAFPERCWLDPTDQNSLLERLAVLGLAGGMVYDAMVGQAALLAGRILLTRDERARRTYAAIGVEVDYLR